MLKSVVLLTLSASFTACSLGQLPQPSATNTAPPTETFQPTMTVTSSPTPRALLASTPTLASIGQVQPIPRGLVYLGDRKTLALGFNMEAGGSIGSLLYNGRELVDRTDFGRYIQLSFYDGSDVYGDWNDPSDIFGWNPIQAGDKDWFGAKVLEYRTDHESVYIKAIGKEWGHTDEDSDVVFETWAWQRAGYFEVHLRGTHTGTDTHALASQEFPAAYFATSLTHEYSYFGDAPFTGAPIEEARLVGGPVVCPPVVPTENWAAFGTAEGLGLILAVPPQAYLSSDWLLCLLSHVTPAVGYISPLAQFDVPPGSVREETIYLIPGLIEEGRGIVYDLIPHTAWTFDLNSLEGWRATAEKASVENGVLTTSLSPDSHLTSFANLHIPGVIASVTMRARTKERNADICLHFITTSDPYWDTNKVACASIAPGELETHTFDLHANPVWTDGMITQLRLSASHSTMVDIDSIAANIMGYAWEFDSVGDTEGWIIWNQLEAMEARDGSLLIRSTGNDPYMGSPAVSVDASVLRTIELRMKIAAGYTAQIFFTTELDSVFDEAKSLVFTPLADGDFHAYTLDMSSVNPWQGSITQIRLDPTDQPSAVEIDYIRIVERP